MIFLGDIAHPFDESPSWAQNQWPWAMSQPIIANLEGALVKKPWRHLKKRKLFNHFSIVDALVSNNVMLVNLANNHIMDVPGALEVTCTELKQHGMKITGAGKNLNEASMPARVTDEGTSYFFLGFGWETIQCRPAAARSAGVNPFRPSLLLKTVEKWRETYPDAGLVIMPHWNYEMELYPQPAHRQLAMAAIDAGADAVIGHHPHRVGGIEIYKGRPIAYSLGNWWMPQGVYLEGKLKYGDESLRELALEWHLCGEIVCHWFDYHRENHELLYAESEKLFDSNYVQQLTPYAGMSHKQYLSWFSSNRIKRKILPIYCNYRYNISNSIKDWYVHMRHLMLVGAGRIGLRRLFKVCF